MPTPAYISLCSETDEIDGIIILKARFRGADGVDQRDLLTHWIGTLQALNDMFAGLDYANAQDVTGDAILRLSSDGTKLIQTIGKTQEVIWEGEIRSGS